MSGRARAKRICQAAIGVFIDPKKTVYDFAREEIGDAFERWFPDRRDPAQRLLDAVLADFTSGDLDGDAQEHLTASAIDLFMRHGLSSAELARMAEADIASWAAAATDRVCQRGLTMRPPGLAEAPATWNGEALVVVDEALHGRLRGVVGQFHLKVIPATLGSDLRGSIDGFQTDLLREITAKLDLLTRPPETPAPPFSIPQPVLDFEGYEDEIAAVQAALSSGSVSISAVQGIGGVGKTELARKVALDMRADFPDGQILVDMLGTTQPREARDAMTDVLVALGAEDIRPATLAAEYHSRLAGRRVLILLDNVASGAGLQELVPPPPAALLVTSRTRFAMAGVVPVELEQLSRDAAKALLGGIVPGLDDTALDALAGLCADLPLALRVAGAYLQETGYPVDAYIVELKERRLARLARSATATEDARLDPEVVLGHSYDRLVEADAGLARAFTLLGVFPADFEVAGAAAVLDMEPDAARERLTLLRRRSLVQQPEGGARWRLHDLLRELAEGRAVPAERQAAAARHRAHYLALLQECEQEFYVRRDEVRWALTTFEGEQANITAAAQGAVDAGDDETAAPGYGQIGGLMSALGRREDALSATEEAVTIRRRLAQDRPDAFNPDLATSLNNLGIRLDALGRREDALGATEEAVDLFRRLARDRPDAFNPDLATSLNNLGNRLDALGRREDALSATEEAVGLYRRLARDRPDAFNPDLATSLNNLGNRLDALGRREDALSATEEAVDLFRRLARDRPDAFNPDLAMSLNNLGNSLDALGRREDALSATEEAVDLFRRLARDRPDAFNPDLAMSLNNLGNSLDALGRREDALSATEEAVAIRRRLARDRPDAFNPYLAMSLSNLADRHDEMGQTETAIPFDLEAIQTMREPFFVLPAAHARMMQVYVRDYRARCQKLGSAPDAELLGPIDALFERLQAAND